MKENVVDQSLFIALNKS